jgi:hypothetical protein
VFGLGALLALHDLGVHERVVSISSVSSGSIANGAVMVGPDFGTASDDEFDAYVGGLVDKVARRGALLGGALATRAYLVQLVATLMLTALGLVVVVVSAASGWSTSVTLAALAALVLALAAAWVIFGQRSERTERAIDVELLGGRWTTLADVAVKKPSVHHVICATKIQGGVSFFFSNRLVYGWNFGGSTSPCPLPLATAVQASCGAPAAFRARRLPVGDLGMKPGSGPAGPGTVGALVVIDGGVYDNMADEWEYNFRGRLRSFPELATVQPNGAASPVVVNASAGWRGLRPITGNGFRVELAGLLRAPSIQYDVSTSHGRRALFQMFTLSAVREVDGAFVQIGDNPYQTVRSWVPLPETEPDAAGARVARALAYLEKLEVGEEERGKGARRCASVSTTMKPLEDGLCADLLERGYVLTLVKAFVVLGLADLERAVAKGRFLRRGPEKVPA